MSADSARFCDRHVEFEGGIVGESITFDSANPRNYFDVISRRNALPPATIDGKLFLPRISGRVACVILVPGSLGVAPSHLMHAQQLTQRGVAAFVIDPFGARGVSSTVANQTQYSFAASAFDVLGAVSALAARPDIDTQRIGAQGHSRGGSAVLTAATRPFADAVLERGARRLRAVYAAYPWSGHQFLDCDIASTVVRAVVGDRDEWCLAQQVQGHVRAMQLMGGNASVRIFAGAHHSFDRDTPIELVADASVSPGAPTAYVADDGAFVHPLTGIADPDLVDRDLMVYGLKAGYGRVGARIGSAAGDAAAFRDDMLSFWDAQLV